jgi:predicted transcriptional regulator
MSLLCGDKAMIKILKRKLSPANLEIMKIIWEKGDVTVNDVFETINTRRKDKLRRTTIQVQMNRLEDYGWLKHRQEGRTYVYSAAAEKQKTRRDILDDITLRVFGGSRTELVKCLLENSDVSSEDIKELRELLKKS